MFAGGAMQIKSSMTSFMTVPLPKSDVHFSKSIICRLKSHTCKREMGGWQGERLGVRVPTVTSSLVQVSPNEVGLFG